MNQLHLNFSHSGYKNRNSTLHNKFWACRERNPSNRKVSKQVRQWQRMNLDLQVYLKLFKLLTAWPLGLPWFLRTVVEGDHVNVVSGSIFYSTLCLFGTVILLILCLILNKWYLNKFLAVILFFFYMCYVSIATLFGLNVFGDFNQPTCKR